MTSPATIYVISKSINSLSPALKEDVKKDYALGPVTAGLSGIDIR